MEERERERERDAISLCGWININLFQELGHEFLVALCPHLGAYCHIRKTFHVTLSLVLGLLCLFSVTGGKLSWVILNKVLGEACG